MPGTTGSSFVQLDTTNVFGGALSVKSYFTPADVFYQTKVDADVGVSGPAYVPDGNLVYGGGKTGRLYLLDAMDFGGFRNNVNSQIRDELQGSCNLAAQPQPNDCSAGIVPPLDQAANADKYGHIHGTPAYWALKQRLFIWGQGDVPRWHTIDTLNRKFGHLPEQSAMNLDLLSNASGTGGLLTVSTNSYGEAIVWATYRDKNSLPTYGQSETIDRLSGPTIETGSGYFVAHHGDTLRPLIARFPI
jgi:hypothetical protein